MSETRGGGEMREGREQEPKIKVEFFFAPHWTAEDAKGLAEKIKECDVYIPESPGWDETTLETLNNVSRGLIQPRVCNPPITFQNAQWLALYNSGKIVALVDVMKIDPDFKKMESLEFNSDIFPVSRFVSGEPQAAVQEERKIAAEHNQAIQQRERLIAERLKSVLYSLTERYPALKDKKEVKVLVFLGSTHTDVYINLKNSGSKLLFEIRDTGVGIPKEDQKSIFQKFFRSQNVLKYQTQGSGLGLHITKSIIEKSGGKIWFKSKENKGSTFWFTLPIKK